MNLAQLALKMASILKNVAVARSRRDQDPDRTACVCDKSQLSRIGGAKWTHPGGNALQLLVSRVCTLYPIDSSAFAPYWEGSEPFYQQLIMVHIADLTPIGHPQLIAVGWLARGAPFSRGPVSGAFVAALISLLENPWQPRVPIGAHGCEFCRISGGPAQLVHAGRSIQLGALNLYIPHEGKIFVSPSLMAHYIDAHEYAPPDIYQAAVLRCPPMRSIGYLKAIVSNGPPGFLRREAP